MNTAVREKRDINLLVREPVHHVAEKACWDRCCTLLFNLGGNPMGHRDLEVGCHEPESAVLGAEVDVREDRKRVSRGHAVTHNRQAACKVLLNHR